MLGAFVGDIVGSVYEFNNIKNTDFEPLVHPQASYTDDTIMSVAVADWLLNDSKRTKERLIESMLFYATLYPCCKGGYGYNFWLWLFQPHELVNYKTGKKEGRVPYNSYGNGAAMRASACGWIAKNLDEALELGKLSAEVSHDHPEGIKGAQAVATAIYMARNKATKGDIKTYMEKQFGYDLRRNCNQLRPTYGWESSCQGTVPPAITAFIDSHDFESAIRNAISLGGDSDTLACITGGIAEAYYGAVPFRIEEMVSPILPQEFFEIAVMVKKQGKM